MTTSRSTLIISAIALILLALVPAVSATILYDEEIDDYVFTGESYKIADPGGHLFSTNKVDKIVFKDITQYNSLSYIAIDIVPQEFVSAYPDGTHHLEYWYTSNPSVKYPLTATITTTYNLLGQRTNIRIQLFFPEWDIGSLTGTQTIQFSNSLYNCTRYVPGSPASSKNVYVGGGNLPSHTFTISSGKWTKNHITISDNGYDYTINLQRVFGDQHFKSDLVVKLGDTIRYSDSGSNDLELKFIHSEIDLVELSTLVKTRLYPLDDTPGEPTPPQPTLRTGTVTMTDHNGTRISGFEVKAVNYYTGEEYTVSTDTDVATITLPMDRTISWRNPQTGQYEDVPVGYYTFFVYKPGYKMTSEDGVRISVMPEEYSSYHLGDIIVTSEDGYLTGKHQFQIRSRADLSILQTGTISAKSATTGEWFNTTVDNGIATLILPYDTSTANWKYVGNYYVYATSPGYIPSEYATQISVRPDTQSEIRYILLTPIGGIPEPGNVTLRIQAYSDSWQDIPNAEIHIDGVGGAGWEIWETYTASAAGYAEISVPGNSTYDITVYGQGYYSSSQRVEVGDTDPPLTVFILYPTGAPTLTPPTTQPTGWVTPPPTTQPSPGIPDEDDDSEGFLMEAIRGISRAFGVGFATGKTIFGMLLALAIGFTTAKHLRGGAAEFGLGLLGGTMLGVLIGLLPVWVVVVLLLIVGMYVGYRYVGGSSNG